MSGIPPTNVVVEGDEDRPVGLKEVRHKQTSATKVQMGCEGCIAHSSVLIALSRLSGGTLRKNFPPVQLEALLLQEVDVGKRCQNCERKGSKARVWTYLVIESDAGRFEVEGNSVCADALLAGELVEKHFHVLSKLEIFRSVSVSDQSRLSSKVGYVLLCGPRVGWKQRCSGESVGKNMIEVKGPDQRLWGGQARWSLCEDPKRECDQVQLEMTRTGADRLTQGQGGEVEQVILLRGGYCLNRRGCRP